MIINEDQQKFLIDNYDKYSVVKLCNLFNERFDTKRSLSSIYNDCNELGLRKKSYHRYTKYEDDFLRENSSNYSGYDLTIIFNDKFGTNILQDTLVMHCYKLGLTVGLDDGKFKKGSNPWDKTDGDKDNFDINNLRCVSNRTFVRIHANKWLNNGNPDFIDTAIIYSDMVNELRPARIKTRKNV